MNKLRSCLMLLALLGGTSISMAQTAPSTHLSLPEGPLKLTVVGVQGDVGFVKAGSDDIVDAKLNMVLDEGVEVIVGQHSAVQLDTGSGQILTFRRMTSAVVTRAAIESGAINIDVGMKYGQTQFQGEAQDRALRTSVHTPSATLGIRGTTVAISDQPPFAPEVVSLSGKVQYSDLRKRVSLGSKGGGKTRVDQNSGTAAEMALAASYVDPSIAAARSPSEEQLLEQVLSTGASLTLQNGFPIVRGGTPPSFTQLQPTLPLGFVAVLKWTGNVNFDLIGSIPSTNDFIAPVAGANQSQHGFTPFDHQGGPHGGYEELVFPPGYPGSTCTVNAQGVVSGTVQYNISANFTPNGNASDFELRLYYNRVQDGHQSGSVSAEGNVQATPLLDYTPQCMMTFTPSAKAPTVKSAPAVSEYASSANAAAPNTARAFTLSPSHHR